MDLWNAIVRFFQGGGEFMYPIAVVLVVGLAIAIERYIFMILRVAKIGHLASFPAGVLK